MDRSDRIRELTLQYENEEKLLEHLLKDNSLEHIETHLTHTRKQLKLIHEIRNNSKRE